MKKTTPDDVNVSGLNTFTGNSIYEEGIYIHTDNLSLKVDETTGKLKTNNISTSSVPGTTVSTINYVNDKLVLSYKPQLNTTEMGVIESGIASGDAAVTAIVTGQIAMIWTAIGALAIACGINTFGAVGYAIETAVVDKNAKISAEAPLQQSGKTLGLNWNENELSLTDYCALQLDKRYGRLIDWHPTTGQEYGENVANVYLVGVAGTGIVDLIQKFILKMLLNIIIILNQHVQVV